MPRAFIALIVLSALHPQGTSAQDVRTRDSVLIAPGIRVPSTQTGASRAIVDSTDARTAAALTFSELMQARAASVNVLMSGGRLVDGGQFLIRGPSTVLTDGAPLLIVDGIRMANTEDDVASTSSRLDDIAIDDIAKVEVLRGPSAAALYGAGASSGVIVVTTKRGHAGRLAGHVRAVSEMRQDGGKYADRYRRNAVGSLLSSCSLLNASQHVCVPGQLEHWNPLDGGGVFRSGIGANAALDVAGGTSTQDVRLSTTVRRANGITSGDELSQLTARLNATQRIGQWFELTGRVAVYGNRTLGSLAGSVTQATPTYSVGTNPVESFRQWADYALSSPIDGHLDHVTAGGELAIRPTSWLTLRGAASRDRVDEGAERVIAYPYSVSDVRYILDAVSVQRSSGWTTDHALHVTAELRVPLPSSMRAEAVVIGGIDREWRRQSMSDGGDFLSFEAFRFAQRRDYSNDAALGLVRVTVADRLTLAAGARKEKETGADNAWNVYPTADASLSVPFSVLGAEPRIRVAFGESAQRFATSSILLLNGEGAVRGNWGTNLYPPGLAPERMKEVEGGLDIDWGSRGGLAFTAYNRTVADVLYQAFMASTLALRSSGVELDAHAAIVQRKSTRWDVRAVVGTNSNRVTSYGLDARFGRANLLTGYPIGVVQRQPYSYSDANGDGVITLDEIAVSRSFERVGRSTPSLSMALHSELQLGERFTLRGIVDRRSGAWAESYYVATQCASAEASCRARQDPSSSLADQASSLMTFGLPAPAFDASFTRLRELSLRWTVGSGRSVLGGRTTHIALSGRDLATWTQWPGPDPEISSKPRASLSRSDISALPLPRRFTLGVEFDY